MNMKKICLTALTIIALGALRLTATQISFTTKTGKDGLVGMVDKTTPATFSYVNAATHHIKNNGVTGRKVWIRFDTSLIDSSVENASLVLTLGLVNQITKDQNFNIYGITNQTLDAWNPAGQSWSTLPANDTNSNFAADLTHASLLGTINMPQTAQTGDQLVLNNQALRDFLIADTNRQVTFIVGRETEDGFGNVLVAADKNATYPPPTLVVDLIDPPIKVLNRFSYVNTGRAGGELFHPIAITNSFIAGAKADKLIAQVSGEGTKVSSVTYNGQNLINAVAGPGGTRNSGIYYLDNPHTGGPADLVFNLLERGNGRGLAAVSVSGAAPGVAATAYARAISVSVDVIDENSFVMVSYAGNDVDNAGAWNYALLLPHSYNFYSGQIGSAWGGAAYQNWGIVQGQNTFTFNDKNPSGPETCVAVFRPASPRGTMIMIK